MKKNLFCIAALLVPLLFGTLAGVGQTLTDPSGTLGYDAAKSEAASVAHLGMPAPAPSPALNAAPRKAAASRAASDCFIPVDASYTALPRNDDGSFGPIALPFDFHLYGTVYRQVWINTNGNLTFSAPYNSFSSSGFPSPRPMVAPFWADVDTRNPASGAIYFKLSATNLIVTWDNVGYYGNMADKLNTFQAIIGANTDLLLGPGQNVSLRYGDMQWTTGLASSGVNGFGGVPATVGANNGNGRDYVQVGRFSLNSAAYDGPGGAYDGVNYLDGQCYGVNVGGLGNVPPSASNLPLNSTVNVACGQTVTLDPRFLGPEVNQTMTVAVNTGALCNTTVTTTDGTTASAHIVITGSECNVGTHPLVLTVTDNGSPVGVTTVTLNVVVAACCSLQLTALPTPVACVGGSDGALDLMVANGAAPFAYRWSNGATTQDLAGVPAGSYTVTVTDGNSCSATATYALGQQEDTAPTVRTRNITLPLNAAGTATLAPAAVDNGSTDNCGFTLALSRTAFDCTNLGPNTVTLTATDAAGHSASQPATVTVVDTELPTLAAPVDISAQAVVNTCSAPVRWPNPVLADNCSATLTSSHPNGAEFPVGETTVVLTATDPAGNRISRSFRVTVLAEPLLASISATAGPKGYHVGCFGGRTGTATVSVRGGCPPYRYLWSTGATTATVQGLAAGTHSVTITDANGAQAGRTVTLTQAPALVATASASSLTTFSSAQPRTIYRGYGTQSLTLQGTATGGVGGYTFTWAPATGLSTTTGSTVTASPIVTTTYTLSATDANGCTAAQSTVVVNVVDVRCGNKNDKVLVCHNGHEICISANAVPAHLDGHPNDALGTCVAQPSRSAAPEATPAALAPALETYPNPFSTSTTIRFRQPDAAPAQVRIYDGQGRVVTVLFNGLAEAGRTYSLPLNAAGLPTGLYLCRYESAGRTLVQRLAIVK